MSPFDQVYESSRVNGWSGYFYVAIGAGIAMLIALSLVRNAWIRRPLKLVAIFGFAYLATVFNAYELDEKWRIRFSWAKANPEKVSEKERFAMEKRYTINASFGPMLSGMGAIYALVASSVALFFVRLLVVTHPSNTFLQKTLVERANASKARV